MLLWRGNCFRITHFQSQNHCFNKLTWFSAKIIPTKLKGGGVVEKLFGRIPFEQHFSYAEASLNPNTSKKHPKYLFCLCLWKREIVGICGKKVEQKVLVCFWQNLLLSSVLCEIWYYLILWFQPCRLKACFAKIWVMKPHST